MELFGTSDNGQSLAWRMQPGELDEILGQSHLIGKNKPLRRLIEDDKLVSLIFFGPPGTGKTALAHIIAKKTDARFISLNAVTSGIKDIRDAVSEHKYGKPIVFIDEIHRFNKLQQDALLPSVEQGKITLIGASTQNPSFAMVPALLSRSLIFRFHPLSPGDLASIINRAVTDPRGFNGLISIDQDAADFIASVSAGDARKAMNILEISVLTLPRDNGTIRTVTKEHIQEALDNKVLYYDEEDHYNTISAFIKSMRGSSPDAALYWLAKMIESGEDPMFIARRIVICASEDVGNADPRALILAVSAMQAVEKIGMPEGKIPLAQAVTYIAAAPKSNASYLAIENAIENIRSSPLQEVPQQLKDSHYAGAKRLGHGEGYLYPHDYNGHYVRQTYLKDEGEFYKPSGEGFEKIIKSRLQKRRNESDGDVDE